jgi:hypothetical protein
MPWFLLGYFQNSSIIESLSADNREILYSVINSTDSPEDKAKIGERYQIGIHIRRGDYLSIPEYGVLSKEYFLGILSKLMHHDAQIVVASDEEQCLEPFGVYPNTTLLFPTTTKPLNTMEFLSQSDLFIMSNSTFSFWIAWAVTIHGGVVYAPQPWFNNVKTPENYLYLQGFNRQLSIFESLHGKR